MTFLIFVKKAWLWSKVNWKFLVGFAIPCIVLYFINQKKAQKVLKAGIEFRKKQLDVAQRAADLESAGLKKNAEEFADRVEEVITRHDEAVQELEADAKAQRDKLGGSDATQVTEALADKFDLDNKDKQK